MDTIDWRQRLRDAREMRGLTQGEVAARLSLASPTTISHYESGKRGVDVETLRALAGVYAVSIGWLAGDPDAVWHPEAGRPAEWVDADGIGHHYCS